jgi:hypothetical protein
VVVVAAHGELHRHRVRAAAARDRVRVRGPVPSRLGNVAHRHLLPWYWRCHRGLAAVRRLALPGARVGRFARQLRVRGVGWGVGVWVGSGARGSGGDSAVSAV